MITIGIIIFWATWVVDLITDYRIRISGKQVNHTRGALLRVIGLIPAGLFLSLSPEFKPLLQAVAVPGMFFFTYWSLFDPAYNILTGEKVFYIGGTASLDKLQRKHRWLVPGKYIASVLFITLFIIL